MRFSVTEIKDTYTINTGVLVLNDYCITAVLYFWGEYACLKFFDGIVVSLSSI